MSTPFVFGSQHRLRPSATAAVATPPPPALTFVNKLDPKTVDSELVSAAQLGRINFTIDMVNRMPDRVLAHLSFVKVAEVKAASEIQWGSDTPSFLSKFVDISQKGGSLRHFKPEFAATIVKLFCAACETIANTCGRILEALMTLDDLDRAVRQVNADRKAKGKEKRPALGLFDHIDVLLKFALTTNGEKSRAFTSNTLDVDRYRRRYDSPASPAPRTRLSSSLTPRASAQAKRSRTGTS